MGPIEPRIQRNSSYNQSVCACVVLYVDEVTERIFVGGEEVQNNLINAPLFGR
jgi:hypothetical protein